MVHEIVLVLVLVVVHEIVLILVLVVVHEIVLVLVLVVVYEIVNFLIISVTLFTIYCILVCQPNKEYYSIIYITFINPPFPHTPTPHF